MWKCRINSVDKTDKLKLISLSNQQLRLRKVTSHGDHFPRSHLPFHDLKKKKSTDAVDCKNYSNFVKNMYLYSKFIDLCILNQIVADKFSRKRS